MTDRFWSAYRAWGVAGAATGAALVTLAGVCLGSSLSTLAILLAAPVASFFGGVALAHLAYGEERIVLYQQLAAALGGTALALWIAGEPVRPGLDLLMPGLGLFLALGRVGCSYAGCCYGRRRFPIQRVASAAHAMLTAGSVWLLALEPRPGAVLCFYLSAYAPVRFVLELGRGDDEARWGFAGLSEAQWSALLSGWLVAWAGVAWGLELAELHVALAAAVTGLALGRAATAFTARR